MGRKRQDRRARERERRAAIARIVKQTRQSQGLPATVEDPEVLDRIARLIGNVPERERP